MLRCHGRGQVETHPDRDGCGLVSRRHPHGPVASVQDFERDFLEFMRSSRADILADIVSRKALDADLESRLKDAILEFKKGYNA